MLLTIDVPDNPTNKDILLAIFPYLSFNLDQYDDEDGTYWIDVIGENKDGRMMTIEYDFWDNPYRKGK